MHRSRPLASGVLLMLLAACSPIASPDAPLPASDASTPPSSAPTATPTTVPSASPGLLPEAFAPDVISTGDEEYRITFSPDGTTAYFARGTGFFPQTRQATILESRLVDGDWTEPTIAPFSGEYPDIDPWVAPDGRSIYFSSIRPVDGAARDDAELFRVDREADGWSEPVHLASIGSDRDELGASVAADGRIVFASDRAGGDGGWDLYVADPGEGGDVGDATPLDAINSPAWEFNPAISADGSQLVFTSIDRAGGSGLGDLFVAESDAGVWEEIGPLALNSTDDEYHASWSPDGETLYFVRRSGHGDLFAVPWSAVRP